MRQHGTGFPPMNPSMDFQQKGWAPDSNYQNNVQKPFYPHSNMHQQMMVQNFPPPPIPYQNYGAYHQFHQNQSYQYPYPRQEAYYSEVEPQMILYQNPQQQNSFPQKQYQPNTAKPAQIPQQTQIPTKIPNRTEQIENSQNRNINNVEVSPSQTFDPTKYPTPGCFGIINRGKLPQYHYIVK